MSPPPRSRKSSRSRSSGRVVYRRSPSAWSQIPRLWKIMVGICIGIVALGGATTVVVQYTSLAEPWWWATHAHVEEKVKPVDEKTNVLMYWKLDDQKNIAKQNEGGWAVQLQRETDPRAKELIQQQIDRSKVDQQRYDARIQQLKVPDWIKR